MSIVIDANMKLFADRMGITSSRMIRDYGLKTVDQIIEAEAAKGNQKAVNYAMEMYNSPAKLIQVFKLTDVENKFVILHKMDSRTREMVLPLLDNNDLVMGMYFFTQEKLLEMLMNTDIEELVRVVMEAFPIEKIVQMFTEEDLAMFFQNDKLERHDVMENLKALPEDVMQKFIEGVTGKPATAENQENLFSMLENLPDDKFRDFMSAIDPDVQRQLTFQLTKNNPEYLTLFENKTYVDMLSTMMKQDMVKPMVMLDKDTLIKMNLELPDDLLSIVAAQVDTKNFAEFLLDGHLDVLQQAMMI